MRLLFASLALFLVAAAAPRDWSTVARVQPDGVYVIGNPAARVKLVEYASYTCPHCAEFMTESASVLKGRMIRSGSTSLAVRPLIRDSLDLAAVVVARCGGARGFPARHAAIFAAQDRWIQQGAAFLQANSASLEKLARPLAFRRIADGAGLIAIGRAQGLTEVQLANCFIAPGALDKVAALNGAVPAEVQGTPAFYVNGTRVAGSTWAQLEPALRAQGAR